VFATPCHGNRPRDRDHLDRLGPAFRGCGSAHPCGRRFGTCARRSPSPRQAVRARRPGMLPRRNRSLLLGAGRCRSVPAAPAAFHVMAKPTGAICDLDCEYCFFLSKELLYPGSRFRMAEELQETYLRQLQAHSRAPEVVIACQGGEPTMMGLEFFRASSSWSPGARGPASAFSTHCRPTAKPGHLRWWLAHPNGCYRQHRGPRLTRPRSSERPPGHRALVVSACCIRSCRLHHYPAASFASSPGEG
jgi:hypothetical protein